MLSSSTTTAKMHFFKALSLILLLTYSNLVQAKLSWSAPGANDHLKYPESDPRRWYTLAEREIWGNMKQTFSRFGKAKNAIIFLGDGMGPSTVTAARIYKGQLEGQSGEEGMLSFDKFPHSAIIKTYNLNFQVPDSAGTGTAYLTGVKANLGTLGVNGNVDNKEIDCELVQKSHVSSIMEWAQKAGKSTGIVTTTRVTHASPAAAYAHTQNRNFEAFIPDENYERKLKNKHLCKDIAAQLVEDKVGRNFNVILGGGRTFFIPKETTDIDGKTEGLRLDKRNLINEWGEYHKKLNSKTFFVNDTQSLREAVQKSPKYLMGLFAPSVMAYDHERDTSPDGEPSLSEMTAAAITVAKKNKKGFVLFIEGGLIDFAHHNNKARTALNEAVEFDRAIQTALDMTGDDTSIVVTADHSHPFTINGHQKRGNDILGFAAKDHNGHNYTTLMYANGPGYRATEADLAAISNEDLRSYDFQQAATVPVSPYNTHGGEDVVAYAKGPYSWMFAGTHEQSFIPHVLSYALCLNNFENSVHCHKPDSKKSSEGISYEDVQKETDESIQLRVEQRMIPRCDKND